MSETDPATRRLVVIDGANALFRAFFAIPHLKAPDGTPTNAVYGFATMLIKVLRDESPDYVAVAFDPRGGSFRKRIFEEYKAGRDAMPEDLAAQLPLLDDLLEAFRIPKIVVDDFEADDVIATLVKEVPEDTQVSVISTDKDLMQLVSDRVTMVDTAKDRRIGPSEVEERFGVPPAQILDLRALVGDPSDNIPGVKGIGEKGAAKLIAEWGTLEALLDHADEIKAKRAREGLQNGRAEAELSKRLSALRDDVPLQSGLDELAHESPDAEKLRGLYTRLGFTRLLEALDAQEGATPGAAGSANAGVEITVHTSTRAEALAERLQALGADDPIDLLVLHEAGSAVEACAVGLAIALGDVEAVYVPLLGEALAAEEGLDLDTLGEALAPLLTGEAARPWCSAESKTVQSIFAETGLDLPSPADDLGIAGFLLDPAGQARTEVLAGTMLGRDLPARESLTGRGAKAKVLGSLPTADLSAFAGAHVCAQRALRPLLRQRLEADALVSLYTDVELPLTGVLSRMERAGVRIDEGKLQELAVEYQAGLDALEKEIHALAGEEFLISSPKQLQVILFEKLGLPALKKTKTGYSTAESVLEQLRAHHELPGRILDYRKLSKLMSTYIDALPPLVCDRTGRIHPQFNQLGAATGRLSASNPNVQNIPIRGEEGARIREAFVPAEDRLLLSADYSQVELRVLAHYSRDESLLDAFRKGEDIHRRTAAEVAGITVEEVSDEDRARAKAVNFGIIYGSSAFGLAPNLGIATGEAQETIDRYFERYQGVRQFLDETIAHAKEEGYVVTMLGRRRYLPDIKSRNRVQRQAAERMAVNTVNQGTAAELIKKAMIRVDAALAAAGLETAMLLQVHDELIFEAPEDETERAAALIVEAMQGVASLSVPLKAEAGIGANWAEAH